MTRGLSNTSKQLRAEIDNKALVGGLSSPVAFQEAKRLQYLQACIKEGLRIHSIMGLLLLRAR